MGNFDGIDNASATKSGNWIRDGKYWLRINRCAMHKKNHDGTEMLITEMTCVRVLDDNGGTGHRVGEDLAYSIKKTGSTMYLPNAKALFVAALGVPEAKVTSEVCEGCIADNQPLAGLVIEVVARTERKKTKDGTFTKVIPLRRVEPEEIEKAGIKLAA